MNVQNKRTPFFLNTLFFCISGVYASFGIEDGSLEAMARVPCVLIDACFWR